MHSVIAKLLITKVATPVILAGTLALAIAGAALTNPDSDHDVHIGCKRPAVHVGQTNVDRSVMLVASECMNATTDVTVVFYTYYDPDVHYLAPFNPPLPSAH
jgi:hypothetical protein